MDPIKEQRKGKSNKLQEVNVDDNQFNMISGGSSSQTKTNATTNALPQAFDMGGNFGVINQPASNECSNEEALAKLATMNNRKAFGSEDVFQS